MQENAILGSGRPSGAWVAGMRVAAWTCRATGFAVGLAAVVAMGCHSAHAPAARVEVPDRAAIEAALAKDSRLASATKVAVSPTTGVVKITGRVSTEEEREAAGRIVSGVKGVTVLYNELQLAYRR